VTRGAIISHGLYLAANAFELFIGLLAVLAVLQFIFEPNALYESTVGQVVHPLDYAWMTLYGISGIAIVVGLCFRQVSIEVAGLLGFSFGVSVQLVALISLVGNQSVIGICSLIALILAGLVRAFFLVRVSRGF